MRSLTAVLGGVLPTRPQLFDRLSALESILLQGSLLVDVSIIASIPSNVISEASFGDITASVLVNRFEASASVGSTAFSLDLPITIPSGNGTIFNFGLTDASFLLDFFVNASAPIDIINLFSEDQNNASLSLDFGGTFEASLPMTVGIAGTNIGLDLLIKDSNLFDPNPMVDYMLDLCDVSGTMMDLFDQLKAQIVSVIEAPFQDLVITVNIDKITDPLVSRVDSAIHNFTDGMNVAVSSADCSRRLRVTDGARSLSDASLSPSPTQAPVSLVDTIQEAIQSVNAALGSVGIVLSVEVLPYFNSETFSVGASVKLSATIEQTAADLLELVSDYITLSTNPQDSNDTAKLGLVSSNDTAPVIDLEELLSKVALAAGLDVTFGIDLSLVGIQDAIFSSYPMDEALRKGISLYIDTWGAFGQIIVDPIELGITLFGRDINIRESHFALAAELRSKGKFAATIDEMILGGSAIDTSPLIPELTVPLSTEFVFDINATDEIIVSPIISFESSNLVGNDFVFDFDVDLETFLNSDFVGENNLTSVLMNATTFLQQIASLRPEMNVGGDNSSALDGLFTVIDQLNDFGDGFMTYIDVVNQGELSIFHWHMRRRCTNRHVMQCKT